MSTIPTDESKKSITIEMSVITLDNGTKVAAGPSPDGKATYIRITRPDGTIHMETTLFPETAEALAYLISKRLRLLEAYVKLANEAKEARADISGVEGDVTFSGYISGSILKEEGKE